LPLVATATDSKTFTFSPEDHLLNLSSFSGITAFDYCVRISCHPKVYYQEKWLLELMDRQRAGHGDTCL
jgi:hypothetical protein